jgi:hypothetical protein
MPIKTLLNETAIAFLDRQTQEELVRLRAIAQAAVVVSQSEGIELLSGGSDLVAVIKLLS